MGFTGMKKALSHSTQGLFNSGFAYLAALAALAGLAGAFSCFNDLGNFDRFRPVR